MDPNPRRATKKWVGALRDLRSIRPACLRPRSRLRAESRRASAPRARLKLSRNFGVCSSPGSFIGSRILSFSFRRFPFHHGYARSPASTSRGRGCRESEAKGVPSRRQGLKSIEWEDAFDDGIDRIDELRTIGVEHKTESSRVRTPPHPSASRVRPNGNELSERGRREKSSGYPC